MYRYTVVRYIVSTPEVNAAPSPLAPAVQWLADEQAERVARRVEEEESILDGDDDDDDEDEQDDDSEEEGDSDSDDDDAEDGDDVMEFNWQGWTPPLFTTLLLCVKTHSTDDSQCPCNQSSPCNQPDTRE